nr:unnamed protein product [Digitaria exilis]CAB3471365.1 unnamed protein product [Digitaria exilis]
MGASAQEPALWKQIDDAEHYLVSGSFEQAVSAALSVSDQIRNASLEDACDRGELLEMLESAGMVLVQALKELRRASEMFVQLKAMFGSVASVPVKLFHTGATMQMAAGSVAELRPIFEEYLGQWKYTVLLFSLLFSTIYVLRRKAAGLRRTMFQQASSLRQAFFDALQLAFSVQMNPLAAVQQLPQARGSCLL